MKEKSASLLSRRLFLKGAAVAGCSAAALPLMTPVTFAAVPGDQRLVVIILRGAMDGLDVVRPVGDRAFAGYRSAALAGPGTAADLDGFFALHPGFAEVLPMWQAGELAFAHAVATPYRDRRSHFDGQDLLEAGTGLDVPDPSVRDGWLNRMLQAMPEARGRTAWAVGLDELKVIDGAAPVSQWSPDVSMAVDDQSQRLLERIYEGDPLFHAAATEAFAMTSGNDAAMAPAATMAAGHHLRPGAPAALAQFAAEKLKAEARIAAFSIAGWDTHRNQRGVLSGQLKGLAAALSALKDGLGAAWQQTTVLAMTEFGRTARENGTGGTDHGTGGVMVMAGGALKGGKVYGRWPGVADAELYQQRDLMPTADVRAYAAWAMRGLFGLDRSLLENSIFPRLDMGGDPGILL